MDTENYGGTSKTDQPSFTIDIKDSGKDQYKRIPEWLCPYLWRPKNAFLPFASLFCLHHSVNPEQPDGGKLL